MASRRVVISGLGPISGLGVGMAPTWQAMVEGSSAISRIDSFDPAGFDCQIAAQLRDFKVSQVVPKHYRKAVKVMARDIELAVGAADAAARDAGLVTKGTTEDAAAALSYESGRMGAHIGAGLIAVDLNELTEALVESVDENGKFDLHKWGAEGMTRLTPLWLLKYLPNMLACHVTIIHDAQGPSNTITCGEASSGLSIGESLRVIQRNAADLCFCGGTESKLNPMAFLRQVLTGRLVAGFNDQPTKAVKAFDQAAAGTVIGEGGGILILESLDTYKARTDKPAYAELVGFGASQSIHPASRNAQPDPQGKGIAQAINKAIKEAGITPDQVDLVVPFGTGVPAIDQAEAAALSSVFGDSLSRIAVVSSKAMAGNTGAGTGALDACVAAKALAEQTIPARLNCDNPLPGINAGTAAATKADLRYVVTYSMSLGGQNAAMVLKRYEG